MNLRHVTTLKTHVLLFVASTLSSAPGLGRLAVAAIAGPLGLFLEGLVEEIVTAARNHTWDPPGWPGRREI